MADQHDSMIHPEIEGLVDKLNSKFSLCTVAAGRAREINAYYGLLGDGVGTMVPPQVNTVARKPLSIAFEEIAAEKIIPVQKSEEPVADADGEDAQDAGEAEK